MSQTTITMPLELTSDMLKAVREHPSTSTDDKDEEHRRVGWLLCAWDVLTEHRLPPPPEAPNTGNEGREASHSINQLG